MAQGRTKTKFKQKADISAVFLSQPRRKRPNNDNAQTPLSRLGFRAQRRIKQRKVDLDWQIRFASMKLHHWHNLDDWDWDPLTALLNSAEVERKQLG